MNAYEIQSDLLKALPHSTRLSILDILRHDENHRGLPKRLQDFDFSPCVFCNSWEMASENVEDCFGNVQPACGGCLWARGLIRGP